MTKQYFFSILTVTLFSIVNIQGSFSQAAWTQLTPAPQENSINDMVKIPGTDKIIAVADRATIMISNDGGETWELKRNPGGLPNAYALKTVYFYNSTVGYMGGNAYLYDSDAIVDYILKTQDGGLTWTVNTELPGTEFNSVNGFYFIDEDTGFAVGYQGKLLKTIDGGENWDDVESGVSFSLSSIDFYNDSSGYIVGKSVDTILKTTDYGNTWTKTVFNSPFTYGELDEINFVNNTTGFFVRQHGEIFKTTDAGASWEIVYADEDIKIYTFDFIDGYNGIATGYKDQIQSCIIKTENGGETWEEVYTLPIFQEYNYSICYLDLSNIVFCGLYGSIYKSSDGGGSWSPGLERDLWGNVLQVQFMDSSIVYCLANDLRISMTVNTHLYKSENGGEGYYPIFDFATSGYNMQTATAFYFIDQNTGFLTYYNGEKLTVLKTIDGGNAWDEIEIGNFDDKPYAINFFDEQHGLISGSYFILKTSDGGNTWQKVYNDIYCPYLYDIHYFTENEIIVVGDIYPFSNLLRSHDGGVTWEKLEIPSSGTVYDIEVVNNSIVYLACGGNAILKSIDAGNTWENTQINNENGIEFHSIYFPSENIGYAVGTGPYETIMKTTDGGQTWNTINPNSTSGINAVYFKDENNGLVFGENGVIMKTTTGGIMGFEEMKSFPSNSVFEVYPNPFTDKISISLRDEVQGEITVDIYGLDGRLVLTKSFANEHYDLDLGLSGLECGIYFCNLNFDGQNISRKIIKTK